MRGGMVKLALGVALLQQEVAGSRRNALDELRAVFRDGPMRGVHVLGWWRGVRRFTGSRWLPDGGIPPPTTFFGEGATAEGEFHEAMNLAGVRQLPVVFICDNNQWAYSTPTHLGYAVEHLADRAAAYGFEGVVVDGTDVLAVSFSSPDLVGHAFGPTSQEVQDHYAHLDRTSDHRAILDRLHETMRRSFEPRMGLRLTPALPAASPRSAMVPGTLRRMS